MIRPKLCLCFLVVAAAMAAEQRPYINYRGVLNAASYMPGALPGGAIAQGSIFTIFGSNLGPLSAAQPASFPLPTQLAGVSIRVMQGATGADAIPVYVSANQINAILPSNTPVGTVSISVTYNGTKGNWVPVRVVKSSVGLFSINSGGFGPGVIYNVQSASAQPVNSSSITAKPGQLITVWATGLGPVTGSDQTGPAGTDVAWQVEMFVGGRAATRVYAGRSPCCSGLDQLVFRLPAEAPAGCNVPVQVRTGGVVSNTVTLAIDAKGERCADPRNPEITTLQNGGKLGAAVSSRFQMLVDIDPREAYEVTTDRLSVSFRNEPATEFYSNPVFMSPPAGACLTYSIAGDVIRNRVSPPSPPVSPLNAGDSIMLEGSSAKISIAVSPAYKAFPLLMSSDSAEFPLQFNTPGSFRISGAGGNDVGAFNATVTTIAAPVWTDRDSVSQIRRGTGLTMRWSGVDASKQSVLIQGIGVDVPGNASAIFECLADASTNSFTVPDYIIANLPAPAIRFGLSDAILMVGAAPQSPGAFAASGIAHGLTAHTTWVGRTVTIVPEPSK